MSSRFISPFYDIGSGIKPPSGAKLEFFEVDGVTPKDTFSDQLSTPTPNTNPVVADSLGVFGDIYIDGTYKVTLKDKNDVQIFGGAIVVESTSIDYVDNEIAVTVPLNIINDLSQAYDFDTRQDLEDSLIVFPLKKVLITKGFDSINDGGQAPYVVTAGTSPDNGSPDVAGGNFAQLQETPFAKALQYGVNPSMAANLALVISKSAVTGGQTQLGLGNITVDAAVTPDDSNSSKFVIKGVKRARTAIKTDFAGVTFWMRESFEISDLSIGQTNVSKVGEAISTNNSDQSKASNTSRMIIDNFRHGIFKRFSLYDSYNDLQFIDNICGIRLGKTDKQTDDSNPDPSGTWNQQSTGWFHNVINFINVLFEKGEVGFFGSIMCGSFIGVTAQNQNGQGVGNSVLPDSQKGTGVYLDAGVDGNRDGWNNSFMSYYSEGSEIALYAKGQKYVGIDGMFCQGGAADGRAQAAIIADNSHMAINGIVGQGLFTNIVEAKNGADVVVEGGHKGSMSATQEWLGDATSDIRMRGYVDTDKSMFRTTKTGAPAQVFTLPDALPERSVAKLYLIGVENGVNIELGELLIVNFSTGGTSPIQWLTDGGTPPSNVVVAVSNGGVITITLSGANDYSARWIYQVVGGEDVSNTVTVLTGV